MRRHMMYIYVCFSALTMFWYSTYAGWDPLAFMAFAAGRTAAGRVFFHK